MEYQYDFMIAGIPIRWKTQFPLELDERYRNFLYESCAADHTAEKKEKHLRLKTDRYLGETSVAKDRPVFTCEISSSKPKREKEQERVLYEGEWYRITENAGTVYRTFPYSLSDPDCVVTLERRQECPDMSRLYLPQGKEEDFISAKVWAFYMALEEVFYTRGRILLHASCIETDGGAVLFTGPSGIGKSTQADMWSKYRNAVIINGDRTVLYEENGHFFASGSPYAGSSKIYRNIQSEIRAVVICGQGEENKIRRCSGREILLPLMKESTFPYMDGEMRRQQAELLFCIAEHVPVYTARFRKDESAVEMLEETLENPGQKKES